MAVKPRRCEVCGGTIEEVRLELVPESRRCKKCSHEQGSDTLLRATTKATGKTGSLKSTGTDVESAEVVRRKLNPPGELS